jgi:hypothetical protein
VVDSLIILVVPGAIAAGLGDPLFWGSLAFALFVAFWAAVPVNRWLIARGKGHAVVHQTGIHGGPSPRTVGLVAAVAFVFGVSVLGAEIARDGGFGKGGHGSAMAGGHGGSAMTGGHSGATSGDDVRGLSIEQDGMRLSLARTEFARGQTAGLRFRIVGDDGTPLRDFEVEHERRLHLIVARRDMTGFQHLHPTMRADGTWTTPLTLAKAGSYRVFADFKRDGKNVTLAGDLSVDGSYESQPLPAAAATARTTDGAYEVTLAQRQPVRGGEESELRFQVRRGGEVVTVEPYLGARGHLVALREGDLAYLHVHPLDDAAAGDEIEFATAFPSSGRYRLFLQFKDGGTVHTAPFTVTVAR